MHTTRTFVAVAVPTSLDARIRRLQSLLAPDYPTVRWSEVSPFHLTLAFLGDLEDTDLLKVCKTVEAAVAGFPPFDLRIEGLGVFPNPTQARVLWLGVTGPGIAALQDVWSNLTANLTSAGFTCESDFSPHITLGRLKRKRGDSVDLTPALSHYRTWSAGTFPVTEIITFSSTLTSEGPEYTPLARVPLKARKG